MKFPREETKVALGRATFVLWLGLAAFNMFGQRNLALLTLMTLSLFNSPFLLHRWVDTSVEKLRG